MTSTMSMMMPLFCSSLLLSMLIPISILPNGSNATNDGGNEGSKQPSIKNKIVEEIRRRFIMHGESAIQKEEDKRAIQELVKINRRNRDDKLKLTKKLQEIPSELGADILKASQEILPELPAEILIEISKKMPVKSNERDEKSIQEVVKFHKKMPEKRKNEYYQKLFKDALIAKIVFNRFKAIYDNYVNQFNGHCFSLYLVPKHFVLKLLEIFALNVSANVNLEEKVEKKIEIFGNAFEFYQLVKDQIVKDDKIDAQIVLKVRDDAYSFDSWLKEDVLYSIVNSGTRNGKDEYEMGEEILTSLLRHFNYNYRSRVSTDEQRKKDVSIRKIIINGIKLTVRNHKWQGLIIDIIMRFNFSLYDEDKNAIEEVSKIFIEMPDEWKEKRFEDALFAKIAFKRFKEIYDKFDQQKDMDRAEKEELANKVLAVFEMQNNDNLYGKLLMIKNIAGIAISFFQLKKKYTIYEYSVDKELQINNELKNEMVKEWWLMKKFQIWLGTLMEEIGKDDINIKRKTVNEIGEQIFNSMIASGQTAGLFTVSEEAVKVGMEIMTYANKYGSNWDNRNAVEECMYIFWQMSFEWQQNRVREPSSLLQNAMIAKIAYNQFKELFEKFPETDLQSQNIIKSLWEKVLQIINLTKKLNHMKLLSFRVNWTIKAVENAIKFYEIKKDPSLDKTDASEKSELNIKLKEKMMNESLQMNKFRKWLEKLAKEIVKPGEIARKKELQMAEEILKSLYEGDRPLIDTKGIEKMW